MSTQFHAVAVDEHDDDARLREEDVADAELDDDLENESSSVVRSSSRATVRQPRVKSRTYQCSRCAICSLLIFILTLMCASFFAGEYYALTQGLDNSSLPLAARGSDAQSGLLSPDSCSSKLPVVSIQPTIANQTDSDDDDSSEPNEDSNDDSESPQSTSTGGSETAPRVIEVPNSATDNGVVAPEVEQEEQETELEIELEGVLAAAATDSFIDGIGLGASNNNMPKPPSVTTGSSSYSLPPTPTTTPSSSEWQQAPLPQFLVERCALSTTPTQPFQYHLTARDQEYYTSQYRESDPNEPYLDPWVWPVTPLKQLQLQSTNDSSPPFHTNAYIPSQSPSAYLSSFTAAGADRDWVANRERYEAILDSTSLNAAQYRDEISHYRKVDSRDSENIPEVEWDQYQPMIVYLTEEDPESHPRCDGASGYHLLVRCYADGDEATNNTNGGVDINTAQPIYKSTPLQFDHGNGVYSVRILLDRPGSCYFQAFLYSWIDGESSKLTSSTIGAQAEPAFALKIKVKPAPEYDVSVATIATRILTIEADARVQRVNPIMPSKVASYLISLDSAEAAYRMLLHLSLLKRRRQECTTASYLDYRSWGGAWYRFPSSQVNTPCAIRGPESFMPGDVEIRPATGGDATDPFLGPMCSTDIGVSDQTWIHAEFTTSSDSKNKTSEDVLWLYAREDCYVHIYSPQTLLNYWHDSHVQFVSGNAERDADDGLTKMMKHVFSSSSGGGKKEVAPQLHHQSDTEYVMSTFQALNPSNSASTDAIKQFCQEAASAKVDPMEAFLTKVQAEKNSTNDLNSRCILALSNIRMNSKSPPAASDSEAEANNCGPVLNFSPLALNESNGTKSSHPFEMNLAGLIMSFTEIMLDDPSRSSYFTTSEIDSHRRGVLRRPAWKVGYGQQHGSGSNESEYLMANLESKPIEASTLWNMTYNGQCSTYDEKAFVTLNETDTRPAWLLKKFQQSLKGVPRNFPEECLPSGNACMIAGSPTTFLSEFLSNAFHSLRQYFERIIKQHHERNRFIQELKHTLRSILFELQRRIDITKQGYEPPRGSMADSLFQLLRKSRSDPPVAISREELEDVPLLLPLPTMVLFRDEVVSPFDASNLADGVAHDPYVVQVTNGELKNAVHLSRTPMQAHIFQKWNAKVQKRSTTHYAAIAAAAAAGGPTPRRNRKKHKKKLELCMNVARDLSKVDEMWQYIDDQSIYSPFMLERQRCEVVAASAKSKHCMSEYHRLADRWSSLSAFHAMTLLKEQHIRHAFDSQSNFHTMHCKF